jgi:hypothetical protein
MTVAVLALVLAAPAASAASTGFRVPDRPYFRPQVVCATSLPHRVGLYCESPFVKPHTYDQLGVLRLTADGAVTKIRGGNDLLLAIEGDLDSTQPRSILGPGQSWSVNGYRCARTTTAVRCRRGRHGFTITIPPASSSLHVTVWPNGQGQAPGRTYTLTCAPAGGTLPDRAAACAKLMALRAPFAPTPKGVPCTMISGGPREALVTGRFRGAPVRARFSRKNGCEIARWNRVRFLFPRA